MPLVKPNPVSSAARRVARKLLPQALRSRISFAMARAGGPPLGSVNMGDLATTRPVSRIFGFERGTPIDRYYVEKFLNAHSGDIAGRVLEIGDAAYCRAFGSGVTQQDVLHVNPRNPEATIAGDLSMPGILPKDSFDCMVITQTLHLIWDMPAAVREMKQALKPGGVLLLTVPGISQVDRGEWGNTWYWSLTAQSARRLFAEIFGEAHVSVKAHGNVFAATCYLQGLATEEVATVLLEEFDPAYPVVVTVRAICAATAD